jgi:hypothetical protein
VAGAAGVPPGALRVLANLTVVGHPADGHLTVYSAGNPVPATSNLNYDLDEYAVANNAILRVTGNQVCAVGATGTHLIVDVFAHLGST